MSTCNKCKKIKKDPYLLVNTSSPERCMDVLPKLFKEVKAQVPQARLKYAYGWDIYDIAHSGNMEMMKLKGEIVEAMEDAGVEDCGRLSQSEAAKLYLEGTVLAYPTEFAEIDCISVKKAQACGCTPVTTDFGAFPESIKQGVMIHSEKTNETWGNRNSFGIKDENMQKEWVEAVVNELKSPRKEKVDMSDFSWPVIAKRWINEF